MNTQRPAFISSTTTRSALLGLALAAVTLTLAGIDSLTTYSAQPATAQMAQTQTPARG
ncbi:MAG: hypothetical protein LCH73_11405 [Proteobacteria bacterium]|nr:hypothetical protein [Pseudomonadota bacterium]